MPQPALQHFTLSIRCTHISRDLTDRHTVGKLQSF